MSPSVSIIVPVYNAEKTLGRCVESILGQEFSDLEVLLVDDGSTDGSGALCDGFAQRDPRVRVIHKENTGVSDTRNQGLALARGEYLQFLDSDDWITSDATKALVRAAREHECDLVISDFYRVVGERVAHKGDIQEDAVLSREEYAAHMMERPADFYYGVLWNKLYRREIVERYHLRMNPDISWCEDFMFNLEYIRHASTFYALQVPIYYYVKTKGSLANQNLSISDGLRMKLLVFEYYDQFFKTVLNEEEYERSRLKVYKFLVDAAGDGKVPPAILPGSKKLGDERVSVPPQTIDGEGTLVEIYRERKLLESYLEPVALRHDLTVREMWVLFYLSETVWEGSRKDLAEVLGMSRSTLARVLQKLAGRSLVEIDAEEPGTRSVRIQCARGAAPVLSDLALARADHAKVRLAGLSGAEMEQYAQLQEKICGNVRRALQAGGWNGSI